MELKHTKGPWKFDSNNFDKRITGNTEIYGGTIIFDEGCFESEEGEANGRLIAAAPEMLEALINLMQTAFMCATVSPCEKGISGKHCEDVQIVINVIEKATGMNIEEVLK